MECTLPACAATKEGKDIRVMNIEIYIIIKLCVPGTEEDDPSELINALGVVARARGMTEIAQESGLTREALYRALRAGASPRYNTVARVLKALGLHLIVESRDDKTAHT